MASPATGNGVTSALLPANTVTLPWRDPATAPAHPPAKPDPPLSPSHDGLHLPCGVHPSPEDSEMATEVEGFVEESMHSLDGHEVRVGIGMERATCRVPTLDPALDAVQLAHT